MVQLREEFLNIDSEHYTIYFSNRRRAELPPLPGFYDITVASENSPQSIPKALQESIDHPLIFHESLTGISISTQAIGLYVACDEIDFPLRFELWDTPPDDICPQDLATWFYVAEVSFDLSRGELYIHGLMEDDIAEPIYIAPDTYRIRFYLGSLDTLDESYIQTHWSLVTDDHDKDLENGDELGEPDSRHQDPERNVWCRLVLWPSSYDPPYDILSPQNSS